MASRTGGVLSEVLLLLCILGLSQAAFPEPGAGADRPYLSKASSFTSSQSHRSRRYDYIVVGGGTAGCPLAATLSGKYMVLVLERGGSPYGNRNISYLRNFHISLADASADSPSQAFVSTDGVINARGRVLGGGTAINAGFYSRASPRQQDVRSEGSTGEKGDHTYEKSPKVEHPARRKNEDRREKLN